MLAFLPQFCHQDWKLLQAGTLVGNLKSPPPAGPVATARKQVTVRPSPHGPVTGFGHSQAGGLTHLLSLEGSGGCAPGWP